MWVMATSPPPPAAGAPRSVPPRPPWFRVVRWSLYGSLLAFACVIGGAAVWIALHAAPSGPTFGWPLRLTGRTNILIMGLDRTVSDRDPRVIDPATRRISLLSIPRDTRAPIPGHGFDKINAAHAYGGGALAVRTVQNLLGVRFPYYIEISERGFVHLIDAVGGVTLRIDQDLNYDDNWDGLHIHLKKGNRRLGGRDAVGYARYRHDALGDIGRVQRQQQLLNALLDELRKPRVVLRAQRILNVFHDDVSTNLRPDQLIALAWFGARLPRGSLVRETLPGRFGGYAGYWLPDPAQDRAVDARMFYGVDPEVLAHVTIEVLNATPGRDASADPLARLDALGVRVVRVATAADAAETVLIVHRGDPRVARVIAAALDVRRIIARPAGDGPELTLILGRHYLDGPPVITDPSQPSAASDPAPRHPAAAPRHSAH